MFSILSTLNPYGAAIKAGLIGAVVLAIFFAGWKVESWRWSASLLAQEKAIAADQARQVASQQAAENSAMEQLNDLNVRLTRANEQVKAHPAVGPCLDPGSLRVVNGAIAGSAATH